MVELSSLSAGAESVFQRQDRTIGDSHLGRPGINGLSKRKQIIFLVLQDLYWG